MKGFKIINCMCASAESISDYPVSGKSKRIQVCGLAVRYSFESLSNSVDETCPN